MQERYHRQLILDGFGTQAQAKLSAAKVLVIGAGGLGCPALQYLVAAGIGTIGIADDDTVAMSNLHRQILYTSNDIGKSKVTVAIAKLKELNNEIQLHPHVLRIQKNNVLEILSHYDYIFDGSDNFETRYLVNDACALLKKPLVFAAVSAYEGQLAIFNVQDAAGLSTNYRDLFPIAPQPGEIANCEEQGVLGAVPGLIGTMAANEMIKLITGIGTPLINKLLHYNVLTNEKYELNIFPGKDYILPKNEKEFLSLNESPTPPTTPHFIEIDGPQLAILQQDAATLLIDVREQQEVPVLDPSVFKQVPMSRFKDLLNSDIEADQIVLLCQHGIRSLAAAEALFEKYGTEKKVYSLKGGIVRWRNYLIT